MMVCWTDDELDAYVGIAIEAAKEDRLEPTLLFDQFLDRAIEVDVDLVCDGKKAVIGGVMQHTEEAGVHSGDSTSVLPPHSLSAHVVTAIEKQAKAIAFELGVVGLMNVQFAVEDDVVFILEVNARASRTEPFVAKATGRPLAKIATKVMVGRSLDDLGIHDDPLPTHVAVKESVLPFMEFPGVDPILGPEMRSTGEVMGVATTTSLAFSKSQTASGFSLPASGRVFINTTQETKAIRDSYSIRRSALLSSIPYFTTIAAGLAVVDVLEVRALLGRESKQVRSLQEWHARSRNTPQVKSS